MEQSSTATEKTNNCDNQQDKGQQFSTPMLKVFLQRSCTTAKIPKQGSTAEFITIVDHYATVIFFKKATRNVNCQILELYSKNLLQKNNIDSQDAHLLIDSEYNTKLSLKQPCNNNIKFYGTKGSKTQKSM